MLTAFDCTVTTIVKDDLCANLLILNSGLLILNVEMSYNYLKHDYILYNSYVIEIVKFPVLNQGKRNTS